MHTKKCSSEMLLMGHSIFSKIIAGSTPNHAAGWVCSLPGVQSANKQKWETKLTCRAAACAGLLEAAAMAG